MSTRRQLIIGALALGLSVSDAHANNPMSFPDNIDKYVGKYYLTSKGKKKVYVEREHSIEHPIAFIQRTLTFWEYKVVSYLVYREHEFAIHCQFIRRSDHEIIYETTSLHVVQDLGVFSQEWQDAYFYDQFIPRGLDIANL